MQNRYVGDVSDFAKFALRNALAGDDLRLGVHWYLNADEEPNSDGKFTEYPTFATATSRYTWCFSTW